MPREQTAEQASHKLVFTGVRSMWDTFYWIDDALGRHIQEFKAWPDMLDAIAKDEERLDPIGRLEQLRADAKKLDKDLQSLQRRFSLKNQIGFGPRNPTEIADLSADESASLRLLSDQLDMVGRHIEAVFANVGEQMDKHRADPADRMNDYEIEADVRFHLREDDAGHREDSDNVVAEVNFVRGERITEPWPGGGDSTCPMPASGMFHELRCRGGYRMSVVDYRDMLRIGSVWVDVDVTRQFLFDLDAGRWIKRHERDPDGTSREIVYAGEPGKG